jgi:hypothetical protein
MIKPELFSGCHNASSVRICVNSIGECEVNGINTFLVVPVSHADAWEIRSTGD